MTHMGLRLYINIMWKHFYASQHLLVEFLRWVFASVFDSHMASLGFPRCVSACQGGTLLETLPILTVAY